MTSVSSAARRGFTLIELLVVIAIIGILSSVVLASLNTARNKGADASVKSNLGEARAQAELFYDANGNKYLQTAGAVTDLCFATASVGGVKGIASSVTAAGAATGATYTGTLATPSSASVAACHALADGSAWGASAPLKAGGYYCVDSTGNATSTATALLNGIVICS